MPTKKDTIDDLNALSGQLSDRTRTAAGVIIAIWWSLLIGDKSNDVALSLKGQLTGPVVFAGVAILLDFVQFVAGYDMTLKRFRIAEQAKSDAVTFDETDWRYRLRGFCFRAKQVAVGVALLWVIGILVCKVRL